MINPVLPRTLPQGISAVGRTLAAVRSRIASSVASEEAPRIVSDGATDQRGVELTAYSSYSAKLPTAASRRDNTGGITVIKIEAALPAGWVEYTDEGSGQQYYANEASGETSWTPPASE